jgi:hypothetical protein
MPSLSFEKTKGAKPIAIVKGGEFDGKVLYINAEDNVKAKKPRLEINPTDYKTELRDLKPAERIQLLHRLEEAHAKGLTPDQLVGESPLGKALYQRILDAQSKSTSIDLPEGSEFQILPSPDPEKREVFYIAGASGSGKSYIAKGLAECYKKIFPDRECYLISKLGEDSTLDSVKFLKRLNIESFIEDYPEDLSEFQDCLVIFDDYDTFTGAHEKTICKLIDDLATMGRHYNCSMACLSHYLTNYKKTRLLLNEATHLVVYPMATSHHALAYLLKTHIGMSRDELRDLKKMGRWVCLYKNYPQFLVAKHHAQLLNTE